MDKNKKIKKLKERLNLIEPILNKKFSTSREVEEHVEKNKNLYEEGKEIYEKIKQLEYELMTPKEREEYDEYRRLSKLKAQGKFPL